MTKLDLTKGYRFDKTFVFFLLVQECGVNGKKYTYAQAKDATSYIGRSLRNIGLKTNDVIAIIAPNLPDAILGLLGSSSGGFIATTMNPVFTAGKKIVLCCRAISGKIC